MTKNDYDNKKLSDLRESKKLTQESVAESIGVSRFTIIRAEKGVKASWNLLESLCSFYGIPILELLKDKPVSA